MNSLFAGKKNKKSTASQCWDWISSIFSAFIIASLIRWLVVGLYVVVSGSMEQTLLTGDFVLVSKLHYGARTPITPLQVPMTHRFIPGTKIKAYFDWIQLPQYRLPGLGKISRNDIVVFNSIEKKATTPVDLREYWIKRCIALPGDLLAIDHKQLYINGSLADLPHTVQYRYFMKTNRIFSKAFFEKAGIKDFSLSTVSDGKGYYILTTPQKVAQLRDTLASSIQSVDPIEEQKGLSNPFIYPWDSSVAWNKDNFGPLKVPHKGMTIVMDQVHTCLYKHVILAFEGKKEVKFVGNSCWIDGKEVTAYTFCKDYYFCMGDNRDESKDCRFVGFIPEEYIIGKAVMVLASSDKNKGFFRGMRWNRIFHKIH
ncbi:MAG: signal peptidase I [Amoebophilaceae bacterium]|nr:signal peptidase I [Amoebophilaceae bacterium]